VIFVGNGQGAHNLEAAPVAEMLGRLQSTQTAVKINVPALNTRFRACTSIKIPTV